MADDFSSQSAGLTSPARNAAAVTPNDSTDLDNTTRALYIGGAGNVAVYMKGSTTAVVFSGVQTGAVLPICVDRVRSTDTTATNIVALW